MTIEQGQVVAFHSFDVGSRVYLRTASVVMACHTYNATAYKSDHHWYEASWRPWGPFKVLTVREMFRSEVRA